MCVYVWRASARMQLTLSECGSYSMRVRVLIQVYYYNLYSAVYVHDGMYTSCRYRSGFKGAGVWGALLKGQPG